MLKQYHDDETVCRLASPCPKHFAFAREVVNMNTDTIGLDEEWLHGVFKDKVSVWINEEPRAKRQKILLLQDQICPGPEESQVNQRFLKRFKWGKISKDCPELGGTVELSIHSRRLGEPIIETFRVVSNKDLRIGLRLSNRALLKVCCERTTNKGISDLPSKVLCNGGALEKACLHCHMKLTMIVESPPRTTSSHNSVYPMRHKTQCVVS